MNTADRATIKARSREIIEYLSPPNFKDDRIFCVFCCSQRDPWSQIQISKSGRWKCTGDCIEEGGKDVFSFVKSYMRNFHIAEKCFIERTDDGWINIERVIPDREVVDFCVDILNFLDEHRAFRNDLKERREPAAALPS